LDGGSVAEVPAFSWGFTALRSGLICWFGAGYLAFRLCLETLTDEEREETLRQRIVGIQRVKVVA